jgi:Nuclease A inhibitor-like protein
MTYAEFLSTLRSLLNGLLYPSESDFPVEISPRGLSYRMPERGEVRDLDRVFKMRHVEDWMGEEEQAIGSATQANAQRWQSVYNHIASNTIATTAWHYKVNRKNYTHEQVVILLHAQGVVGLRIRLVET